MARGRIELVGRQITWKFVIFLTNTINYFNLLVNCVRTAAKIYTNSAKVRMVLVEQQCLKHSNWVAIEIPIKLQVVLIKKMMNFCGKLKAVFSKKEFNNLAFYFKFFILKIFNNGLGPFSRVDIAGQATAETQSVH